MKNELLNIKLSDKGTIKSTELVEIINCFRQIEGGKELQHYDFIKKIRKELKILKNLGLNTEGNISVSVSSSSVAEILCFHKHNSRRQKQTSIGLRLRLSFVFMVLFRLFVSACVIYTIVSKR